MDELLKKHAFEIEGFFNKSLEKKEIEKVEILLLLFLVEYLEYKNKGE